MLLRFAIGAFAGQRVLQIPVLRDFNLAISNREIVAARETLNVTKNSLWTNRAWQREDLVQAGKIHFARNKRVRKNRFNLGCKNQETINRSVKQRTDAKLIPGKQESSLVTVVNR